MSLSAVEITQVLAELQRLAGAHLRRIHQQDPHTLLLRTRHDILCLSALPRASRAHLLDGLPPRIGAQDFCQLCRRRLEGRRIRDLTQPEGDRCLHIRFESNPEVTLVAELTGRHANLILVEEEKILGSLLPNRSAKRQLLPGRPYVGLLPAPGSEPRPSRFSDGSPSQDIQAFYGPRLAAWALEHLRQTVARPLRQQLSARRRLVKNLRADRVAHEAALKSQRLGDLLLAQLHRVQPRAHQVVLPDLYYEGDGEPPTVTVALDPRLSAADNAQRYYRRATKARRGLVALDHHIPEVEQEVDRLERALSQVEQADAEALAALAAKTPARPAKGRRKSRDPRRREPFHRFESADGLELLVGRSASDNHRLTFSVARGRDLWMHARDARGAHVVLRLDRGATAPHESLLDAGCLAKHYSDLRREAYADVSWTLRKHVRASSTAGRVYLAEGHTLRVADDPERLRRLMESRSETARLLASLDAD